MAHPHVGTTRPDAPAAGGRTAPAPAPLNPILRTVLDQVDAVYTGRAERVLAFIGAVLVAGPVIAEMVSPMDLLTTGELVGAMAAGTVLSIAALLGNAANAALFNRAEEARTAAYLEVHDRAMKDAAQHGGADR